VRPLLKFFGVRVFFFAIIKISIQNLQNKNIHRKSIKVKQFIRIQEPIQKKFQIKQSKTACDQHITASLSGAQPDKILKKNHQVSFRILKKRTSGIRLYRR
jgi:hypothetical protein